MTDIEKAKAEFAKGGFSLVLCKNDCIITSAESGIKPMMSIIRQNRDVSGYSAADKIVGKAAAFLFVKAKVFAVHSAVMSKGAANVFESFGVKYSYNTLCDNIINRQGNGLCQMELAVLNINEPDSAYKAIFDKLQKPQAQNKPQMQAQGQGQQS